MWICCMRKGDDSDFVRERCLSFFRSMTPACVLFVGGRMFIGERERDWTDAQENGRGNISVRSVTTCRETKQRHLPLKKSKKQPIASFKPMWWRCFFKHVFSQVSFRYIVEFHSPIAISRTYQERKEQDTFSCLPAWEEEEKSRVLFFISKRLSTTPTWYTRAETRDTDDDAALRCCGIIPRKKELEIKLFRFEGKMMAEKSFGGFIMTMLCSYVVAVIAERGDGG